LKTWRNSDRLPKRARAEELELRLYPDPDRLPGGDPWASRLEGARAPRAAGPAHLVVVGRGHEARDHQLPVLQAGTRWTVLRADLRPGKGLGVSLRQVQAHPLPRRHLRPLRRGGHALEGAPRESVICDRCGVEVTLSKVRRERMGHIELAV